MAWSEKSIVSTSFSAAEVAKCICTPAAESSVRTMQNGIRTPVSGRQMRFVSRKQGAVVPNFINASGKVVAWQAMDRDAVSHIFLTGENFGPPSG